MIPLMFLSGVAAFELYASVQRQCQQALGIPGFCCEFDSSFAGFGDLSCDGIVDFCFQ